MIRSIIRRVTQYILVLVLVTFGTTLLGELMPGNPAYTILGPEITEETATEFAERYGLDRPLLGRYWNWVTNAVHGDLGQSITAQLPVTEQIRKALPVTLEIGLCALILSLTAALCLSVLCAMRPGGLLDRIIAWISGLTYATPEFVMAVFGVLLFASQLKVLPALGWVRLTDGLSGNIYHAALPILILTVSGITLPLRVLRADLTAVLNESYITAARARGYPERRIVLRHALKPASSALLTIMGILVGFELAGSIIVETFFSLPGFGLLFSSAFTGKDIIVNQGLVVVIALMYMSANLVVDLCQPAIDPRLRTG